MCLVFFSFKQSSDFPLVMAANRDEYYSRRTAPAGYWNNILGGRDLEGGGTWLGISQTGRIAFLTNYRGPKDNRHTPSRGELVSNYLQGDLHAEEYLKEIERRAKEYKGFNLVAGTIDSLCYFSNYGKGIQNLSPGLYGLSNHLMNSAWPKVERGLEKVKPFMVKPDSKKMLDLMYDDTPAPDEKLPDTGLPVERERLLSSMFIKSPDYGTLCSTVLIIDKNKRVNFIERNYQVSDFSFQDRGFEFQIE